MPKECVGEQSKLEEKSTVIKLQSIDKYSIYRMYLCIRTACWEGKGGRGASIT
jgi:hypothetical protein